MIRALLADDHRILREGIRQILGTTDDITAACEVANGEDTLTVLADCPNGCNLAILDLSMPQGGADLIRAVRALRPDIPILVLSMHNESLVAASALRAGAAGYVTKDSDAETLLAAIRKVAAGGQYVDPVVVDSAVLGLQGELPRHEQLTGRERQIFLHLIRGASVTEISAALGISVKTASTHKSNLMHKLGVDNNVDLVRYAIHQGLIS